MRPRGIADPLTLTLVALLAVGAGVVVAKWKPFEFLRPKPPTEQLTKLQADLAAANLAAEQARRDKDAAVAAERSKLEAQVRAAQEDNAGAQAALAVAPAGPEVKLASAMALRVDFKLAVAVGELPKVQRDAVIQLIESALAGKQAEFDREMARKDAEFATLQGERDTLKAQIPVLTAQVAKAEETAKVTQGEVTVKTNEVKTIADKLDAKAREAGSLSGALASARNWLLAIIGVWAFLAYVLPGLIKHLSSDNPLKPLLRNLSGYATSPLLYQDAKAKLAALTVKLEPTP